MGFQKVNSRKYVYVDSDGVLSKEVSEIMLSLDKNIEDYYSLNNRMLEDKIIARIVSRMFFNEVKLTTDFQHVIVNVTLHERNIDISIGKIQINETDKKIMSDVLYT